MKTIIELLNGAKESPNLTITLNDKGLKEYKSALSGFGKIYDHDFTIDLRGLEFLEKYSTPSRQQAIAEYAVRRMASPAE